MDEQLDITVCVAGGGPAGIVEGLILARAGVDVVVLEKHADFLRDFRGDTVHPSPRNLLEQLGLGGEAKAIEHSELSTLDAVIDGIRVRAVDGRASAVRDSLGLVPTDYGVPIDVLWFQVPRLTKSMRDTLAHIRGGSALVTIPRPGYFPCGLLIWKGSFLEFQRAGITEFRRKIGSIAPRLADVTVAISNFTDVKLLSVQINRLQEWSVPGARCIGDAAHAMSPAFGVGINYAIQGAVALANTLVPVLRKQGADAAAIDSVCAAVQRRRLPTALIQRMQRVAHRLNNSATSRTVIHNPPRLRQRFIIAVVLPVIRPILARIVGYGCRPERISRGVLKPRR